MAHQLVLGNWGFRGLAQPLRYLLEYLGLPYEDKRYLKPEEWFQELNQAPLNTNALANLPYIKDGDKCVFESAALYDYLALKANRADLLGSTADEQITVAQVRGVLQDALKGFFQIITLSEDQYAAKKEDMYANEIRQIHQWKEWAAGANLTYIDFALFELEATLKAFHPESWARFLIFKTIINNSQIFLKSRNTQLLQDSMLVHFTRLAELDGNSDYQIKNNRNKYKINFSIIIFEYLNKQQQQIINYLVDPISQYFILISFLFTFFFI